MKQIFRLALIVVASFTLVACHTTEENYRAAYNKALEKKMEGVDSTTYAKIQAEKVAANTVINGDSLRIESSFANLVDTANRADVHRYGVVVASFKQRFNAVSYSKRLRTEEGHPSYVLFNNKNKMYCVIVKGFDDKAVAAAYIKDIKNHVKINILEPKVWIFEKLGRL